MLSRLSSFVFTKILGWELIGEFPNEIKKYVIIVAPHTRNFDFLLGLLVRNITKLKTKYIGKHTLFLPPYGFIFRWLGGIPVVRNEKRNFVDQIVTQINDKEEFVLTISPEGTRSQVEKWKTGYYYIALGAQIPIVPVKIINETKTMIIHNPFYVSENFDEDQKALAEIYGLKKI